MSHDLALIASRFAIPGRFVSAVPYGRGHINDTWLVVHECETRHVVQRVNHTVFREPVALMENLARVTAHLRAKIGTDGSAGRRVLALLPTHDGSLYHRDDAGNVWRTYNFIGDATTHDTTDDPAVAREAARAVGEFLVRISDLPGPALHVTIPRFHDTPGRYVDLRRAVEADPTGRAPGARDEIAFALARESVAGELHARHAAGDLPSRVTHNDTKLNNVLVDDATGEGLCVVDLDTVMSGLAPYDFGEMVRSAANPVRESDRNLDGVEIRMPIFRAVSEGFLEATDRWLTPGERESLVLGAKLMALENGVRFLTDHLAGDRYFRVTRTDQNLDRARVQLRLVASIEAREAEMERVVRQASSLSE